MIASIDKNENWISQCAIPLNCLTCQKVRIWFPRKNSSLKQVHRAILLMFNYYTVLMVLKKCWKQSTPVEHIVIWEHSAPCMTEPLITIKLTPVILNVSNFLTQLLLFWEVQPFSKCSNIDEDIKKYGKKKCNPIFLHLLS